MARHEVEDVFLIKTPDRNLGIKSLLGRFDLNDYSRKGVALKANFKSVDPFPALIQLYTPENLVKELKEARMSGLTMAERREFSLSDKSDPFKQWKLRCCKQN